METLASWTEQKSGENIHKHKHKHSDSEKGLRTSLSDLIIDKLAIPIPAFCAIFLGLVCYPHLLTNHKRGTADVLLLGFGKTMGRRRKQASKPRTPPPFH